MSPYSGVDTSRLLVAGMRVAQANHRIIANNIANVDTPGYNPVSLDFQATLSNAIKGLGRISLRKTRPRHFDGGSGIRLEAKSLVITSKNDYNKVDIDKEITNLAKNTGDFNLFSSMLVKQFQMVKSMLANER